MSEAKEKRTITLDADALDALIEAKVQARLAGQTPPDPLAQRLAEAAKAVEIQEQRIPCLSPTGATFTARVCRSRSIPQGRVVELLDYTLPLGVDVYEDEGGKVPKGMPMRREGTDQRGDNRTVIYKRWLYENFWLVDLKIVGQAFHRHYAIEPDKIPPFVPAAELAQRDKAAA